MSGKFRTNGNMQIDWKFFLLINFMNKISSLYYANVFIQLETLIMTNFILNIYNIHIKISIISSCTFTFACTYISKIKLKLFIKIEQEL